MPKPISFELVDLDADLVVGVYESAAVARAARAARKLRAWEIWGTYLKAEELPPLRVEHCHPSDSDDDRVRQARGEWNASEVPL